MVSMQKAVCARPCQHCLQVSQALTRVCDPIPTPLAQALPFSSTAPFAVNQSLQALHEAAAQSETPPSNLTSQQQLEADVAAIAEAIQNDLYRAADAGDVADAELAISKGASVHTPNKDQWNKEQGPTAGSSSRQEHCHGAAADEA